MHEAYDKQIFADNLQRHMEQHHETQADVAKLLGISKSNVTAYIKGEQIPRMDKIIILCHHYGIEVSGLLETKKAAPEYTGAEKQLLEIFNQLDNEGQRLAIGMLKTLLTEHAQKNNPALVNEVTG